MTDEQIIKAFDYCYVTGCCNQCPFYIDEHCSDMDHNVPTLAEGMLDVALQQKAEIERLKEFIVVTRRCYKELKAEAVKEFAERLKKLCRQARYSVRLKQELFENTTIVHKKCELEVVDERDIDNLVKEMVGED